MTIKRLWQSFRLLTIRSSARRTEYIKKKRVYGAIGDNCTIQKRKVPLYANLIRLGNNVHIASNVSFITHDVSHLVYNNLPEDTNVGKVQERIGCIEIGDNVFIGSGVHILYDTRIGSNVIIGTCAVVTHDIPDNSVAVGVPAKVIGTFDEYTVNMRKQNYPTQMKPRGQMVSAELAEYMWDKFDKTHGKIIE